MRIPLRRIAGLAAGSVTAAMLATVATVVARVFWPDYAAAEPQKAYSFTMLMVRLAAGAWCTATAVCATTVIARDTGRAGWWLGGLFLAVSLPIHLFRVWGDYPAWYHIVYLSYLVPVAGLTGMLFSRWTGGVGEAKRLAKG